MFWTGRKSPLDGESEDWLIDCWRWLLDNLDDLDKFRASPLVLPDGKFFPLRGGQGHAQAEEIFKIVANLTGTANWPFELVPQAEDIDPAVGPLTLVRNVGYGPAGTFSVNPSKRLIVTYNPGLLDNPLALIATLVHEIAHAILLTIKEEVPGGPDLQEWATDVSTVFMGFGLFGANSAVEFRQFTDVGSGSQGWSLRRSGYLNEAEWAFSLAIFLSLRKEPLQTVSEWLKPSPKALLKQSMKYLDRHPDRLAKLT